MYIFFQLDVWRKTMRSKSGIAAIQRAQSKMLRTIVNALFYLRLLKTLHDPGTGNDQQTSGQLIRRV